MDTYFLEGGRGEQAGLGVARMRLVVPKASTGGAFAVAEFRGQEGPWTVPHLHRQMEECFYVLEGAFTFTCGDQDVQAAPGAFLLVPRGMRHLFRAGPGGGALLTIFTPPLGWRRCSSNWGACRPAASPTRRCAPTSRTASTPSPPDCMCGPE